MRSKSHSGHGFHDADLERKCDSGGSLRATEVRVCGDVIRDERVCERMDEDEALVTWLADCIDARGQLKTWSDVKNADALSRALSELCAFSRWSVSRPAADQYSGRAATIRFSSQGGSLKS